MNNDWMNEGIYEWIMNENAWMNARVKIHECMMKINENKWMNENKERINEN